MALRGLFPYGQQLTATTLVAALIAGPVASQTPAQQPQGQSTFKLRVESELVLVNVVARDKQGKPITDLKQGDFTLLEDGKPQRISSFDYENLDTTPLAAASGLSQPTTNGPATPPKPILTAKDADQALSNKRVIVLF